MTITSIFSPKLLSVILHLCVFTIGANSFGWKVRKSVVSCRILVSFNALNALCTPYQWCQSTWNGDVDTASKCGRQLDSQQKNGYPLIVCPIAYESIHAVHFATGDPRKEKGKGGLGKSIGSLPRNTLLPTSALFHVSPNSTCPPLPHPWHVSSTNLLVLPETSGPDASGAGAHYISLLYYKAQECDENFHCFIKSCSARM